MIKIPYLKNSLLVKTCFFNGLWTSRVGRYEDCSPFWCLKLHGSIRRNTGRTVIPKSNSQMWQVTIRGKGESLDARLKKVGDIVIPRWIEDECGGDDDEEEDNDGDDDEADGEDTDGEDEDDDSDGNHGSDAVFESNIPLSDSIMFYTSTDLQRCISAEYCCCCWWCCCCCCSCSCCRCRGGGRRRLWPWQCGLRWRCG